MVERVKKTFIERLFGKFWVATKVVPMRTFIITDSTLICHPSLKDALEEHIETLI